MAMQSAQLMIVMSDAICSHCNKDVVLDEQERVARRFKCPYCKQDAVALLPTELGCPSCNKWLRLDAHERVDGRFTCSICKVTSGVTLPTDVRCPVCLVALQLDASERASGNFACPGCNVETLISHPSQTPMSPEELRLVTQRRSTRDLIVGSIWLGGGLCVTIGTLALGDSQYLFAYGPMGYGGYRLFRGMVARR